ncbi:hypothetical protein NSU08_05695 [Paenibacillus sp. FSL H7-0331]|uniref:hypothetical protein n=1 Tax=Paenibacillus sp. FSL H7-0331 TaxID=1920421 RepID=UPI0030F96D77
MWIEAENWADGEWDIYDDNTDVIVTFEDGSRWVASFFTYKNIQTRLKRTEVLVSVYVGIFGEVIRSIDECSRNRIEEVIRHLINEVILKIYLIDVRNPINHGG